VKRIEVCIGVDVDAVAGWLGSYGGQDSPNDIQRGMFAGEVGTPRLLKLFGRYGIKTSWFIPGHSIETFPSQMAAVAAAGHEIGAHGYAHENPIKLSPRQEQDILGKSIELIKGLTGRAPAGYVAPWWEMLATRGRTSTTTPTRPRGCARSSGARRSTSSSSAATGTWTTCRR
jgi:peptidoglycan/xylan/chitin deacetylase (PgdA/CDA1 family)